MLPRRFELFYINENGEKATPVVLHRAIFGTFDRFTAFIIEETKGAFPLWLAPLQVNIIPVSCEHHLEYCNEIKNKLLDLGFRVEVDSRNEKLGYKMRESQMKKVPMTLVLGDKEKDNNSVNYRTYSTNDTKEVSVDEFIKLITDLKENKK